MRANNVLRKRWLNLKKRELTARGGRSAPPWQDLDRNFCFCVVQKETMADGPAQLGGRSAPDFSALDRTVVVLCCAKGIKGGRSAPLTLVRTKLCCFWAWAKVNRGRSTRKARTVRPSKSSLSRNHFFSEPSDFVNGGRSTPCARTVRGML